MLATKVYAKDCFEDDNGGYMYGVEGHDSNYIEWFKTEKEQEKAYQEVI